MVYEQLFIDGYELPKRLSKEEIDDLIYKTKLGDTIAREQLIIHHVRLVLFEVTSRFKNVEYEKQDLVSVGIIGLMKAIETFDTSKKIEFATYAARCIDNEILTFLRSLKNDKNIDSLDTVIIHDRGSENILLKDIIGYEIDLDEEYINKEIYYIIRKLLNNLPERDKKIIMLYFGFYNDKTYTLSEIAKMFSISISGASRIMVKDMKYLKQQLEYIYEESICFKPKPSKENSRGKTLKYKTIYEFFHQYTNEQVNQMLSELTQEEINLIRLRYGANLDSQKDNEKWNEQDSAKFYTKLVPKMKRTLARFDNEDKAKKLTKNQK